jgi:hypothetical protein
LHFPAEFVRPLWRLSLVATIGILLGTFACRSPERSPVGPSTDVPLVTATVDSVPVPLRTQIGGLQGPAYQLVVEVTFRESAGVAARITRIDVVVVDRNGERGNRRVEVSLDLAARGAVRQTLAETVSVRGGREPARLLISGAGLGQSGRPFNVQAADEAVAIEGTPSFPDAMFVGAGDIADCGPASEQTARLLDRIPGAVFAVGDVVYPSATPEQFAKCYDPTWGRHRARTFPSPGNHDWEIDAGGPYFDYFGAAAGIPGLGYYSFELGDWHIMSLNSNVPSTPGSPVRVDQTRPCHPSVAVHVGLLAPPALQLRGAR